MRVKLLKMGNLISRFLKKDLSSLDYLAGLGLPYQF